MQDLAITVNNFSKSYGAKRAVDGISFDVRQGEIFGLLGPNGAGKTTTLECLEGLRRADGGALSILGVDPGRQAGRLAALIGVQLQTSALPASMTPVEALRFFAAYHGQPPALSLIDRLGLGEKRNAQYGSLSVGQQRRLALALAAAHRPKVLFLDEPTAGLDVAARAELHALIGELRAEGATVVLATHDMAEAEKLADRVAILLRGKIAACGTPRELTATGAGQTKVSARTENAALAESLPPMPGAVRALVEDEYAVYFTTDTGATVAAVLQTIGECGDKLVDLRVERPSLEERFLEITQREPGRVA
ncbi:MAG: ABC transporter ATP-binding protein [Anaerolineae bacterium]|nr:ABC transporter ATP-binding protein [Anaerolineae bacterium]